jgi:hypothetical protein
MNKLIGSIGAVLFCTAITTQADDYFWEYVNGPWSDPVDRHVLNAIDCSTTCPVPEVKCGEASCEYTVSQSTTLTKKRQFNFSIGASHVNSPTDFPINLGWTSGYDTALSFNSSEKATAKCIDYHSAGAITALCGEKQRTDVHRKMNYFGEEQERHSDVGYTHAGRLNSRLDYNNWEVPKRICSIHNIPASLPPYIGAATCLSVP